MIDIPFLELNYFAFDLPVPYKLKDEKVVEILPINLDKSALFLAAAHIISIDKNSLGSVEIIQMNYLNFLCKKVFAESKEEISCFNIIMSLCLGIKQWQLRYLDDDKPCIYDMERHLIITYKEFDDIRRIIMFQNLLNYDDEYISPELKQAFNEVDELKNRGIVEPTAERKISIITAHCGLPKSEQLKMTFRAHQSLFQEVYGEVDYTTKRPIAVYAGKDKDIENWIFHKQKNKYDKYVTSVESYNKSMGGNGKVAQK